ncbi:MAG: phosphatase PAP2 family protein [Candidatus Sungbacteria bacterium]|uniref:Phosphatase PAP2 family protein n=1 Tax=Candidatus Sungiibacteriota bacterium TaxID=2750080 RepID=A0A931WPU4_9BACT|nr:phosphatase PAP2 family protein [Candidatus Sungbacteria bacterium]
MTELNQAVFHWLNGLAGVNHYFDLGVIFAARYLAYIAALVPLVIFWETEQRHKEAVKKVAAAYAAALIVRFGVVELIRLWVVSPRPFMLLGEAVRLIPHESSSSFPSGHAAFFFSLAASFWFYHRKSAYVLALAALLIGVARVMAGVHWPSDILGGAVVGIVFGAAIELLLRKFFLYL